GFSPAYGLCRVRLPTSANESVGEWLKEDRELLNADPDPLVALSSVLGRYALYNILENVIRNAAKYHVDLLQDTSTYLQITLDVIDEEVASDYYKVRLYDSVTDPNAPDQNGKKLAV